jgi:hypothetical protein
MRCTRFHLQHASASQLPHATNASSGQLSSSSALEQTSYASLSKPFLRASHHLDWGIQDRKTVRYAYFRLLRTYPSATHASSIKPLHSSFAALWIGDAEFKAYTYTHSPATLSSATLAQVSHFFDLRITWIGDAGRTFYMLHTLSSATHASSIKPFFEFRITWTGGSISHTLKMRGCSHKHLQILRDSLQYSN